VRATIDTATGFIAWNGIRLHIPGAWDARVAGLRHLVFEKDFQPQLQIRWEKSAQPVANDLKKKLRHFAGQQNTLVPERDCPRELQKIRANFGQLSCYRDDSQVVQGGICSCSRCHTVILFQLLATGPERMVQAADCLATISCHDHGEILYRIQDLSLTVGKTFILKDYTFGAGLTRLSFSGPGANLQTCKLSPADHRLNRQSMEKILITLTGSPDLKTVPGEDDQSCDGYRSPGIARQMFFRLRREKAFIRARLWHDIGHNRLLAVVFYANRPIPPATVDTICRRYEIIQQENRT
jgi:hypothetical protein